MQEGEVSGERAAITAVDHIVVLVSDLDAAAAAYRTLLGRAPAWRGSDLRS